MQEKILVTGGAGFIGTHTVIELVQDKELTLDPVNYPIANYVKRVKSE